MEKLAVIDLGSSKIDLTLAKYLPSGNYTIYEEMSENVKIVDSYDEDELLSPSRTKEAIEILKMYRMICDVNKVTNVIAVVSSSLRNLKNYRGFLDEVYNVCGFKFRLLSPEDEMFALYSGVSTSIDCPKAVVAYVGFGAVRLVQYNRRNILNQTLIPLGTFALSKTIAECGDVEKAFGEMTEKFREQLKTVEWLKAVEPEYSFIGVGSAFNNCATLSRKIKKYPLDSNHNYTVTEEDFGKVYDLVKSLQVDNARKIKGVSNDKSDIIASGLCIIRALVEEATCDKFIVSTKGLKEGYIYGSILPNGIEKSSNDMLGMSLDNINAFYDVDYNNAKQVTNLALILFRQLKVLHKLPRGYVKVLRIAAAMHDCGKRIKYDGNEKNSFNIILNSDLLGVTHREIILASFVCASQNLSNFNLAEWVRYKDILLEEDLEAVRKLALLIRLASALDKTHRNVVQDVSCDILGDSVIMKTIVTMDANIEIREAIKTCPEFKKVYKKVLEVL